MEEYQQLNSTPNTQLTVEASTTKELLRLSDEPCIYIGEYQIHQIMLENTQEFMSSIQDFYKAWSSNSGLVTMPIKQVFQTKGLRGDFRVMPCSIELEESVKSVKVIGTNEENSVISDKICVGKALLIDSNDNYIYAILDVCALSSYRTAAISVLAFSRLCDTSSAEIGLIGLGRIGFYHAYILHTWLGVKTIYCYDKDSSALDRFVKLVDINLPQLKIKSVSREELIDESSVVFLSTDSEFPIIFANDIEKLDFVSSVGADANNLSEIDSSVLSKNHQLVTDSLQSLMLGDMYLWKSKGLVTDDDVIELKDLVDFDNKTNQKKIFISTGVAVQDALISKFITDKIIRKY